MMFKHLAPYNGDCRHHHHLCAAAPDQPGCLRGNGLVAEAAAVVSKVAYGAVGDDAVAADAPVSSED